MRLTSYVTICIFVLLLLFMGTDSVDSSTKSSYKAMSDLPKITNDEHSVYLPAMLRPFSRLSEHPFGITAHLVWNPFYQGKREHALQMLKDAGIQIVRIDINWEWIEYNQGEDNWNATDDIIKLTHESGFEILAVVLGSPSWANAGKESNFPPNDAADYARFMARMVERYDGDGVNDAPGSPRIGYWEIWNEPNIPRFWQPQPDPEAYVALLKAAYSSIKQADPSATVLLGGLVGNGTDGCSTCTLNFLSDIYHFGGKGHFDIVAIHPYTFPDYGRADLLSSIAKTFAVINENDDAKPVWVTEIGWYTAPNPYGLRQLGDSDVADWIEEVYSNIVLAQVERVFWYNFRNKGTDPLDVEHTYGLVDFEFNKKPQYWKYQALQK